MIARIAVLSLVFLLACEKKEDVPRPTGKTGKTGKSSEGTVNAGLASPQGGAVEGAKSSLVAQQCSLACGVHPETDPGLCTQRCLKECMSATDLPGIDACAQRVAAP